METVPRKIKDYHYIIGVDPGSKTGMCIVNTYTKQIVNISTTTFWGLINTINDYEQETSGEEKGLIVVMENPNANKPVFMSKYMKGKQAVQVANYASKIGQNVGMNKREASLIMEYCDMTEIEYLTIKPTKSKWDAKQFEAVSGITTRTSEHARDAYRMIFSYGGYE